MKYNINKLPKKVKVVKDNDEWEIGLEIDTDLYRPELVIYLGLEAGILEPYDEEEEEQEKLRKEIVKKVTESNIYCWQDAIKEVLKDYKITKR